MPLYTYKVSDASGTVSELLLEGSSQADALRRIQRRGLIPLEFLGEGTNLKPRTRFRKKFDVVEFTDRLVPLLEANITLEKALAIMGDDPENSAMQSMVGELRRGLHEGRKLSELIRERSDCFPPLYAGIVEAGEESGALPIVMGELRGFLQENRELRGFIVSASIYPAFICAIGIIMLGIVLGVIVPKFANALAGAGIHSSATDALVAVSTIIRAYWWGVFPIIALVWYIVRQIKTPGSTVRAVYDRLLLKCSVTAKWVIYANIARFCRTMAILMRNGVHLLNTVAIANRVIQNSIISDSIAGLAGGLRQGQRLSDALSKSAYIPNLMLRMLAVGEETGQVEIMLERVADRFENDLRANIKRMLSLFEPLVIVILGVIIGTVVTIMFLAIMDLQGAAR